MIAERPQNSRQLSGVCTIELVGGFIALVPIVLLLVNLVVCILAINVNDAACRDAARAAACGPPDEAHSRASRVILQHGWNRHNVNDDAYILGPFMSSYPNSQQRNPRSLGPDGTGEPVMPPAATGGQIQGSVEVDSYIMVRLPASIPGLLPERVRFDSRQRFPYTYEVPGTAPPPL